MLWAPEITLPYLPLPGDISSELMMYLGSGARRSQKRPSSASFLIPASYLLNITWCFSGVNAWARL